MLILHPHRLDTVAVPQLIEIFYRTIYAGNKSFFDADGVYVEFFVKLPAKRGWQVGHFGKSRHLFLVQPPVDLPGAEFWLAHPDKFRFDLLFCQRLEVTLFHAVHRFFRTDMKNPSVSAASPVQVR